ncbi:MAG TPA: ABC transporter permease [Longimicrobiales bacterium]|nr:ABC transporter permease [Longimicrobiales bacterium]
MDGLIQDFRQAFRSLSKSRTFTLVAVLCLALGIGVNSAIFDIVNAILLRPLPFRDAERVVAVFASNRRAGDERTGLTYADLRDLQAGSGAFSEVAGYSERNFTLTGLQESERVEGSLITPNLFSLLGVQPRLGRTFRAEEAAPAGFEQVVLLSDGLWRRRFGADPSIVGRPIRLNDRELIVVGVMPPGFRFPETDELWLPMGSADPQDREHRYVVGVARLAGGVPLDGARTRADQVARRLATAYPATHRDWAFDVVGFREAIVDPTAYQLMYLMLGAVAFVLLIACGNVANLMMARATDRQREIALRAALGASRRRIVRWLLTESVVLALLGGTVGLLLSVWWVELTTRAIPEELAYWIRFGIDARVLLYTAAISVGTGVVFGILPAVRASRPDLQTELREAVRGGSDGRAQGRIRGALVGAEIALSLTLLIGATLMMKSFLRLQTADPGFRDDHILSMRTSLVGDRYDAGAAKAAFFEGAAERLRERPGVAAAVATSAIPADDGGPPIAVEAEGTEVSGERAVIATFYASTTGLFETLGVRLIAGRDFTAGEARDSAARVAIVGRTLAARLWPGRDAIGRRIRLDGDTTWLSIIGVAPDLQYEEFGEETPRSRLQVHVPYGRAGWRGMALLVRGTGDPAALARGVRAELRSIDPLVAPFDLLTMPQRRRYTTWEHRVFGYTFLGFGGVALLLALAGVYGVMAYAVARRRREIGIRLAVGAPPRLVLAMVLSGAARLTAIGLGVGILASLGVTWLMGGRLLYDVSPRDPATFLLAPLLLAGAALLASWLPARRAAMLDPVEALRP